MRARTLLLGASLVASIPAAAGERLTLQVTPAVAFAPATLMVRAVVEPNAANRWIEIIADSGDFYRSSQIQLEGEAAARTTTFQFRNLPGGTYDIRVALTDAYGQSIVRRREVTVVGGHGLGH